MAISSRFEVRNDPAVVRNFGSILVEYSKIVPDGIVAFFPSYLYMESIVAAWNDMVGSMQLKSQMSADGSSKGILNEVWKHKLIFVETPDANETSIALENYRRVGKRPASLVALTDCRCHRRAIMAAELSYCLSLVVRSPRVSISITTMGEL